MVHRFLGLTRIIFSGLAVTLLLLFGSSDGALAQHQPQQGPPFGIQPQAPQQPQQPLEYAFRPDLSNPQYGECLNLERRWKNLWQTYYQLYNQARMMNPSDPQYAQMANYVNYMKRQLDSAWADFSQRCVYFPNRR